nr:MAG TPA: hypothetical protein [Caudoviricetes sp.]
MHQAILSLTLVIIIVVMWALWLFQSLQVRRSLPQVMQVQQQLVTLRCQYRYQLAVKLVITTVGHTMEE